MFGSRSIIAAVSLMSAARLMGSCRSARGRANISMSWTMRFNPSSRVMMSSRDRAITCSAGILEVMTCRRATNARDRVLHLVCDHRSHFAELGERFLLGQPLLELHTMAQVVKNPRKAARAVLCFHFSDGKVQRGTSCRPCAVP